MRQASGVTLLVAGLSACFCAAAVLAWRDYLGAMMLVFTGTSLLRGSVEVLRRAAES